MKEILLPTKKTQDEIKADTAKLIKESATQEGIDAILEILNSAPTGVVKSVQRGFLEQDGTFDSEMVSIEKVNADKSVVITTNVGSYVRDSTNTTWRHHSETGHASLTSDGSLLYVKSPLRYALNSSHNIQYIENDTLYWQVIEFY